MNSNVHPVVVVLVLIVTAIAVAIWTWGTGMAASFGGPAELRTGPDARHFIQVQNRLVEHDADGRYLKTHDLEALGVDVMLGGFAFFSDGDILLRRGPDPRSFLDNLRAFQRHANRSSIAPESPDSGLFRCNLDTFACARFGSSGIDFKAAYSIFIDPDDRVYIGDTTRHVLRKYASDGSELAGPAGKFRFPNQLLLHEGRLLIADTNHHVIRVVEPREEEFAQEIASRDVVPAAAARAGQTWPSHFARIGNEWWVNNMRSGMNEGGLYVFDQDWNFLRRIDLPSNADPIALLAVGDEVWVSDWNNDVVRRFTIKGKALPDLESAGLAAILDASAVERRKYEIYSYTGIVLVLLVFLGLLVRGFAVSMNKSPGDRVVVPAGNAADDETDAALFLEPDPKALRRVTVALRLAGLAAIMLAGMTAFILAQSDAVGVGLPIVAILASLFGLLLILIRLRHPQGIFTVAALAGALVCGVIALAMSA